MGPGVPSGCFFSPWVLGSRPWLFFFLHVHLARVSSNLLLTPGWCFIVASGELSAQSCAGCAVLRCFRGCLRVHLLTLVPTVARVMPLVSSHASQPWEGEAGACPSAARHCGGAQSTAAPPSAPLLPRGRAGAQYDMVPLWCGTLWLSDTSHVESGELSCGAHVAQTARLG